MTVKSLENLGAALKANKARQVFQGLADFVRIYVDAAYEETGHWAIQELEACVLKVVERFGHLQRKGARGFLAPP